MNDVNLACFLSVVRTLNFSISARALSMTQQAVSRNIQKLEEELGVSLLNRNSQTVMLTWAGERFFQWCRDYDASRAAAELAVHTAQAHLSIGWGDWTGCPEALWKAICRFRAELPQVELSYVQGTHREIMEFIREGTVNLALLPSRCVPFAPELTISPPLLTMPLYAVVGVRNPICAAGEVTAEMISSLPQLAPPLLCEEENGDEMPTPADLFACRLPGGSVLRLPNVGSAYAQLLGGTGYTISPANSWISGRQALRFCPLEDAQVTLSLVQRQKDQNPWRVQFEEVIRQEVRTG